MFLESQRLRFEYQFTTTKNSNQYKANVGINRQELAFSSGNSDYFSRFGAFFVLAAVWLAHSVNRKIGAEIETKAFSKMFDVSVDEARKCAVAAARYSDTRNAFTPRLPEYEKLPNGQYLGAAREISSEGTKRKQPFTYLELLLGVCGTVQLSFGDELMRKLCEYKLC